MTDRVDAALRDLARRVEFPATPDLRHGAVARLGQPRGRAWWPVPWPRALVLALIATVLVVAAAAAVALVLPGLRLTVVPSLPATAVPDGPLTTRLALGTSIAPDTVGAGIPSVLGEPDEAYVLGDHEVLSLVYAAGDDLPELGGTEIGLLVQVIDGSLQRERIEKLVVEVGASLTPIEVNGAAGYWIDGPPHLVRYTTPSGATRSEATRFAGDTLIWQRGDVLVRIESGLGMAETLRIAGSIGT